MCGISAILHSTVDGIANKKCQCATKLSENQANLLKKRGPDSFGSSAIKIEGGLAEIQFFSTVLHQRGHNVTNQPLRNSLGNVLLWNGEVFAGLDLSEDENDGEALLHLFSLSFDPENLFTTLSKIQGPWAFIYWECLSKCLWFGRDFLGRRSLLWSKQSAGSCCLTKICSVADFDDLPNTWEEVPADGVFCIDLKGSEVNYPKQYRWSHTPSGKICSVDSLAIVNSFCEPLNKDLPTSDFVGDLYEIACDRDELTNLSELELSPVLRGMVETFTTKMEAAVKKRTNNLSQLCKDCLKTFLKCDKLREPCFHSSVAVLYSGGVDSIFLAALADRCVPEGKPIDLLNVSFQHKIKRHVKKGKQLQEDMTFNSPDRLTGRDGLKELKAISNSRIWNFVEINVTSEELQNERMNNIQRLILPSKTVLDDSIGCAIWFAARGEGFLTDGNGCRAHYRSPARVVLIGMGADEQLAGYSRHRAKFSSSGWNGLIEEVAMEIDRISCRNLGRDDRVISDHGKEARLPFLDEDVMQYLKSLPMWCKANLSLPRGIGEKLLLRLAAASLGLTTSAILPKRAVQFGSRIAHSEDRKEKGSDVCSRLEQISSKF